MYIQDITCLGTINGNFEHFYEEQTQCDRLYTKYYLYEPTLREDFPLVLGPTIKRMGPLNKHYQRSLCMNPKWASC